MIKNLFKKHRHATGLKGGDWTILGGGLVVFALVTLWTIANSSIWFDEAFGAYLIHFDYWEIARYTATDVHPPLYYWLLKTWSLVFGTSELALRSMSLLFAGIAIVFGFLLTHRLFGRKAAWLSLLLMVLSPMLIRYSQEMRMYAVVAAITMAATYVLTFAIEGKRRSLWILYGVLVGLGMWTHYFAAIVWLSHWAWRAWVVRGQNKKIKKFLSVFFSKEWILAHIVAVGVFILWLPALIRQLLDVQTNGFWIPPITPGTLPNFFTNVLYYQDQEKVVSWMTLLFLVIMIAIITFAIRLYRSQDAKWRQAYMLIFAIAFVPAMLLIVSSMPPFQSSFVDRYLVPSTVGIALFIGVTLAFSSAIVRPVFQRVMIVLTVIAMIIGVSNVYQLGNYNKTLHSSNNTRQAVEAIVAKADDGQPIIADSPWLFYEAVFYSTDRNPVYFINANTEYKYGSLDMLRYSDQHKIKDLDEFTRQHPVVWYLGRPGTNELTAPGANWKQVQQVVVNDSVNHQPLYKAVQYQIN